MALQIQAWEYSLLARAQEALNNHHPLEEFVRADVDQLESAYEHCDQITNLHSKTFFMASALLPPHKRRAVRALYAFCRITDDIVDSPANVATKQVELRKWQNLILSPTSTSHHPVALAWADTRMNYNIPSGYTQQLIDGVARDMTQTRYSTFAELADYSYGVASTVGLMAMHIIGFKNDEAIPYAVRLGVALQLTNILRDVGEDWRNGRLYLPLEELQRFGIEEEQIANGVVNQNWINLVDYQIARTHRLYDESWVGIRLLNADGRFAIAAAADLYRAILGEIIDNNYDVFSQRASVSKFGKISRLPGIWCRAYLR
ncbi:MAG UNVERIFIED_CONTAM: phytoene/squalene synthase family protein [Anaerolineae bacterium]|jgi:phytoene synthase